MNFYTLYDISKLVLILCTMSIMIIMFQDIIVSRIKRPRLEKKLKPYEKEEAMLWSDFKKGLINTVYISSSSELLLENKIIQILSKYDIDIDTLDITYENSKGHPMACITHKK